MKTGCSIVRLLALALLVTLSSGCGFEAPPAEQAATFVAAVQQGMTWEQVIAVKAPRKWAVADSEAMGGHKQMQDFNEQAVRDGVAAKSLGDGFVFQYRFHEEHAYKVWFDETGKVTNVEKMTSMNDLMN